MRWKDLKNYQKILAVAVTVAALAARLNRLSVPVEWMFDEIYHAYSAEFYALNDPKGYEWWHPIPEGLAIEWLHPPVEKLLMAASIKIFSHPFEPLSQTNPPLTPDVTFAWRFPTAVCTSLTVLILVLMGSRMFNFWVGLLAGIFYAIDPLSFTHGRLATSDGILTFFSTWSFYRLYIFLAEYPKNYLRNLIWLGVTVGLTFSTKLTGTFNIIWSTMFVTLLLIWKKESLDRIFTTLLAFGLIIANVYLFSFTQWWIQGHTFQQFYELHNQIIRYHVGLKATHPFSSHPFSWPFMTKPVWIYMGYDEFGNQLNIWSTGNKFTWYGGVAAVVLLIISLIVRFYKSLRVDRYSYFATKTNLKIIFLLVAYFGMFLPWAISPRIMFIYHYLPAIPFLFILLAYVLFELLKQSSRLLVTAKSGH